MKYYHLDTEFNFGKFEGKSLRDVLSLQPSYIDWCIVNLDHFYLNDQTYNEIIGLMPDFAFSSNARERLIEKQKLMETENDDEDNYEEFYDQDPYDDFDWEAEEFDFLTDGQYGDYDDFRESGGDIDYLRDILGY